MTEAERKREWHLDRTVTLGLIVAVVGVIITLAGQTLGAVWWASQLNARTAQSEAKIVKLEAVIEGQTQDLGRIAVIEAEVRATNRRLDRIEQGLDRLIERGYGGDP